TFSEAAKSLTASFPINPDPNTPIFINNTPRHKIDSYTYTFQLSFHLNYRSAPVVIFHYNRHTPLSIPSRHPTLAHLCHGVNCRFLLYRQMASGCVPLSFRHSHLRYRCPSLAVLSIHD